MEMALQAQLPRATVLTINHCCIAHQALYWSNVANGWGDRISPAMLSPPSNPSRSTWAWPPEHPSRADWIIWAAFLNNSPHTILGLIAPLLGPWIWKPHHLDIIPFNKVSLTAFQPGHEAYWHLFLAPPLSPTSLLMFLLSAVSWCYHPWLPICLRSKQAQTTLLYF